MRRRETGFTLIEIAIALGVLAIVTGAALAVVQGYTRRSQLNRAVEEIDTIAKAASQWPSISGRADYWGLNIWELNNRGMISPRLVDGDANPWRGPYYVYPWSAERFAVYVDGVPGWAIGDLRNIFAKRAECCWEWCCTSGGYRVHLYFY